MGQKKKKNVSTDYDFVEPPFPPIFCLGHDIKKKKNMGQNFLNEGVGARMCQATFLGK